MKLKTERTIISSHKDRSPIQRKIAIFPETVNERRSQSFFGAFLYNGNGNFKTSGKANNKLLFRKSILLICFIISLDYLLYSEYSKIEVRGC